MWQKVIEILGEPIAKGSPDADPWLDVWLRFDV
jgi:hypothetical protein